MQARPLGISGAVKFTPRQHRDERGLFLEWYRADRLSDSIGHQFNVAQANVILDDTDRRAVYLAEGLGHGWCAITDQATVAYLCCEPYAPAREHAVNAFDTQLAINWGTADVTISDRDGAAPSLNDARAAGLLPP